MRIQRVSVEGLFGLFEHEIPMKMEDRITIIYSPNGYGKTTILQMVNALFNARYTDLRRIPFRLFRVDFDDGRTLEVSRLLSREGTKRRPEEELVVRLLSRDEELEKAHLTTSSADEWHIPAQVVQYLRTRRHLPANELFTQDDVAEQGWDLLRSEAPKGTKKAEEWLEEIQKSVKVRFIESQRLLRVARPRRSREHEASRPALEPSVRVHAEDLAKAIQSKLAEYAALSQSLDRTFPVRLVEQMQSRIFPNDTPAITEVRTKLIQLEEKRKRLTEAGLLDKQEDVRFQVPEELQEPTQRVLPIYVTDVEQKLSVFDDIAARIDLLKQIVNSRFAFKSMSIDKEKGFIFTTQDGQPLLPTHLSSGEQHMLVLFSELLFRVDRNSLVMIDEPEISLHVTWQQQFLRDLQRVTDLASFDVLIATHSPQIIHDRMDDLTVELRNPVEQRV